MIGDRLPVTLGLVVLAGAMIAVVGIGAGVIAALNRGKLADRATLIFLTVLGAIPSFVGAIVLIAVFAVTLGWFPTFGTGEGFWDSLWHLFLPALALAISFCRADRESDAKLHGRADRQGTRGGGNESRPEARHGDPPPCLPQRDRAVATVSGVLVAGLLVASTIVESAFGISGLGSLLVQSVDRLDFPVVQMIVLLVVTAFVVVNAVVDLLEPLIDPRAAAGADAR